MNEMKKARRYVVNVWVAEAFDHKGVVFALFHKDALPEEVYEQWIQAHLDSSCPDLRAVVDQTFDAREVRQLWAYFCHDEEVTVEEVRGPVGEHDFIDKMRAVGGNDGFYDFSRRDDWKLPFAVEGYFDLHFADSGVYKEQRDRTDALLRAIADAWPF
jgi:hypothetical protein